MSTPLDQQWPPPMAVTQQAYTTHSGHGSVGPVIAVLAVITILGVIAGMIGRLCSGRTIFGHGQYDFEGWVDRKCSSCLDGRVDPPLAPRPPPTVHAGEIPEESIPVAIPVETPPPPPAAQSREQQERQEQQKHQKQKQKQPETESSES